MIRRRARIAATSALALAAAALSVVVPWDLDPRAFPGPELPATPPPPPANAPAVTISLLPTGRVPTWEPLAYRGGHATRRWHAGVAAFLVSHPRGRLLFDAGFGREVDAQFAANPAWARAVFGFDKGEPAIAQLARHGFPVESIGTVILSHLHWDHASAIEDFPDAQVVTTAEERRWAAAQRPPGVIASQFDAPAIRWADVSLAHEPFEGFASHRDLFGDGTVVIVPLPGHTPGSLGLFVTLGSGRRLLLTGDLTWSFEGIRRPTERPWPSRLLVDWKPSLLRQTLAHVYRLRAARPGLEVVPAHDEAVHATIPGFPDVAR